MRIVVGLTKKVGLPGYGSLAAACQVESGEFSSELSGEGFVRRVEKAFDSCRNAVEAELRRQQQAGKEAPATNPSGRSSPNGCRPATPKQLHALRTMASSSRFSAQEIESVFGGKAAETLTISEASAAIDRLRAGTAGAGANGRSHACFEGGR